MKKSVILVIFFVVFSSVSFAKVVDVPSVSGGEGTPMPLVQEDDEIIRYYYSGNSLIASIKDGEVKYYHQGRLSNRIVTDSNGEVVGEFLSLPFGQKIENTGVDYPFTGKEEDESGLYYFGARYYDPDLERFTSVDPVASNEPYSYVGNNPMMFVDPTGMDQREDDLTAFITQFSVVEFHPMMEEYRQGIFDTSDLTGIPPEAVLAGIFVEDIRFYNADLKDAFRNPKSTLRSFLSRAAPGLLKKLGHTPNPGEGSNWGFVWLSTYEGALNYLSSQGEVVPDYNNGASDYKNFENPSIGVGYAMGAIAHYWKDAGFDIFSYPFETVSSLGERVGVLETLNNLYGYNVDSRVFDRGDFGKKQMIPHNSPGLGGAIMVKAGHEISFGEAAQIYIDSGLADSFLYPH